MRIPFLFLTMFLLLPAVDVSASEEKVVLDAVRSFSDAAFARDADRIWSLLSKTHQNYFRELRRLLAAVEEPGEMDPLRPEWVLLSREMPLERRSEYLGEDERQFLGNLLDQGLMAFPSLAGAAKVRIEDDEAQVYDETRDAIWFLRKSEEGWKIEAAVQGVREIGGAPIVVRWQTPSGEVARLVTFDLARKKLPPVDLPRLSGRDESALEDDGMAVLLTIDQEGRAFFKGRRPTDEALAYHLFSYANLCRDRVHPLQPAQVVLTLRASRFVRTGRVLEILRLAAFGRPPSPPPQEDPEDPWVEGNTRIRGTSEDPGPNLDPIHIQYVRFATVPPPGKKSEWRPYDVLPARIRLGREKVPVPLVEILIEGSEGGEGEAARLTAGLPAALERLDPGIEGAGVAITFDENLPWEDALRILVAVRTAGAARLHLEARPPSLRPLRIRVGERTVEPASLATPLPPPESMLLVLSGEKEQGGDGEHK